MCDSAEARACWQWSNFVASCCPDGKPVLRINLDETSLKLYVPARPGVVFERILKRRRQLLREGREPDLKTRRAAVSLIAIACDAKEVQPKLPHIFLVNERVVTKADVSGIASRCRGHVCILRRKSSWVDAKLMVVVINKLAAALEAELSTHRVVLHFDTCSAHLHPEVLKACSQFGIFAHVVAASMTGWLQPLDVAVFSKFKGWVVREVERQRLASATGSVSRPAVLDIYRQAVQAIIQQGDWGRAFDMTGLRSQTHLSKKLLDRLGLRLPPVIPSTLPNFEDFQVIFPTGKSIPIAEVLEVALARDLRMRLLRLPSRAKLPRVCL